MGIIEELHHRGPRILVVNHLADELRRYGDDVRAGQGSLDDIAHGAYAAHDDLALVIPALQPTNGVADDLGGVAALVGNTAGKDADIGGPGLGRDEDLANGQSHGGVDLDALGLQLMHDAVAGQPLRGGLGHLYDDVVGPTGQQARLLEHTVQVVGRDLHAERTRVDELCDSLRPLLQIVHAVFEHDGRVGGDAVGHAHLHPLLYLFEVG